MGSVARFRRATSSLPMSERARIVCGRGPAVPSSGSVGLARDPELSRSCRAPRPAFRPLHLANPDIELRRTLPRYRWRSAVDWSTARFSSANKRNLTARSPHARCSRRPGEQQAGCRCARMSRNPLSCLSTVETMRNGKGCLAITRTVERTARENEPSSPVFSRATAIANSLPRIDSK